MPDYRLYLMDRYTGHIDGLETFEAGDDVEAILLVQSRTRDVAVELWSGGRKVMRIDAEPEVAARARTAAERSQAGQRAVRTPLEAKG